MLNDTIWMYWEDIPGRPKPAFYQLCQETILRHNPNVVILNKEEAESHVGKIPVEFNNVHIIHRVDWIRKKLLAKFGGMYLDSDFICFQNLDSLLGLAKDFDFVGYREWDREIMDNIFVARAGSPILKEAADYCVKEIKKKRRDIFWLDTNAYAMESAFAKWQWNCKWILLPTHLINPIDVCDRKWYLKRIKDYRPEHRASCLGYITSYNELREWAQNKTREEILNGDERVCHIIRHALNN